MCRTAMLNSKPSKSFYSSPFWIKHKPTHGLSSWRHMHEIKQVSLCPSSGTVCNPCECIYFNTGQGGKKMAATAEQWVLCTTNFREISRNYEFRVRMGIMTSQLGCFSSSTFGGRANDYVRTLVTLGFCCIIHLALSSAGRTKPSRPGHYPLNVPLP